MSVHMNAGPMAALVLGGTMTVASLVPAPAAAAADVIVTVFAEHYVVDGRAIDDLGALEAALRPTDPGAVRLYACGGGTERAQMAAAHRFRNRYLELRVLDEAAPQCRASSQGVGPRAVLVADRRGNRPYGIDDEAVARWVNLMQP
jgi:hypothetical protein